MKKFLSLLILVAHATSFAVDQTRIQINTNGSDASKVAIGADALQLQHDQWQRDDQQAAKAKQESNESLAKLVETTNAQFHKAVVTGDASKVSWALSPAEDMATNINTPINGFNALPLEVALDQLIKTADTYNHPTAARAINIGIDISIIPAMLGAYSGIASAVVYFDGSAATKSTFFQPLLKTTCALLATGLILGAPCLYNSFIQNNENTSYNYWNKLEARFTVARTILNCTKADLSAAKLNTPQAQRALEFIRTNDETVTTYKQFVSDVKAGKYESLRLCNKA
jgi:cytochrome c5